MNRSQFTIQGDECDSSQGKWLFVLTSTLLALLCVVSGLARPGLHGMGERAESLSRSSENSLGGCREAVVTVRDTEMRQKEGGKASSRKRTPTGSGAGIPCKAMARATSPVVVTASALLGMVVSAAEL